MAFTLQELINSGYKILLYFKEDTYNSPNGRELKGGVKESYIAVMLLYI